MKKVLIVFMVALLQNSSIAYDTPTYDDIYQNADSYQRKRTKLCLYAEYKGQIKDVPSNYSKILSSSYKHIDVYHDNRSVIDGMPIIASNTTILNQVKEIDIGKLVSFIGTVKTAMNRRTRTKEYYFFVEKVLEGIVASEDFASFTPDGYIEATWYKFIMQKEKYINQNVYIKSPLELGLQSGVSPFLSKMTDVTSDDHFRLTLTNFPYSNI